MAYIEIPEAPSIRGLRFRAFAGESDYAAMAEMMNTIARGEGEDATAAWNQEQVRRMDAWITNFNPAKDRIIAEMDGRMIGAGRAQRNREYNGDTIYAVS